MGNNDGRVAIGSKNADTFASSYSATSVNKVVVGANAETIEKKERTIHYIFSIDSSYGNRIESELDIFWKTYNIEYRQPTDLVKHHTLRNISTFINYWNEMGTYKYKVDTPWFPWEDGWNWWGKDTITEQVNIGVVVLITHGEYDDSNMYIDEHIYGKDTATGKMNQKLFQEDVDKGYKTKEAIIPGKGDTPRRVLIFEDQQYQELESKAIDTLINLSCYSGTYKVKNIMKKLLDKNKVKYALGVDGISEISSQGSRGVAGDYNYYNVLSTSDYQAKGYINYPDGRSSNEELLNKHRSSAIVTFMDWTRGRKDNARTSDDIKAKKE